MQPCEFQSCHSEGSKCVTCCLITHSKQATAATFQAAAGSGDGDGDDTCKLDGQR